MPKAIEAKAPSTTNLSILKEQYGNTDDKIPRQKIKEYICNSKVQSYEIDFLQM